MPRQPNDLTNKRSGRLVAIELCGRNSQGHCLWKCKCDCGKEIVTTGYSITRGGAKSCGCLTRENSSLAHFKGDGVSGFNRLYSEYRYSARSRELDWKLSQDEFKILTSQNCVICGIPPNRVSKGAGPNRRTITLERSSYTYNGIDRIDSDKGYELNNCQTMCTFCNYAKRDMKEDSFKEWINRILTFNKGKLYD
jgi:hypothetical protein